MKRTVVTRLAMLLCLAVCAVAAGVQTSSAKAQLCGSSTCLGGNSPPYACTAAMEGHIVWYEGYYYICTLSAWSLYRG